MLKKMKYVIEVMCNFIPYNMRLLFTLVDLYMLLNFIMILLGMTCFRDMPKTGTSMNVIEDELKAFTVYESDEIFSGNQQHQFEDNLT